MRIRTHTPTIYTNIYKKSLKLPVCLTYVIVIEACGQKLQLSPDKTCPMEKMKLFHKDFVQLDPECHQDHSWKLERSYKKLEKIKTKINLRFTLRQRTHISFSQKFKFSDIIILLLKKFKLCSKIQQRNSNFKIFSRRQIHIRTFTSLKYLHYHIFECSNIYIVHHTQNINKYQHKFIIPSHMCVHQCVLMHDSSFVCLCVYESRSFPSFISIEFEFGQ